MVKVGLACSEQKAVRQCTESEGSGEQHIEGVTNTVRRDSGFEVLGVAFRRSASEMRIGISEGRKLKTISLLEETLKNVTTIKRRSLAEARSLRKQLQSALGNVAFATVSTGDMMGLNTCRPLYSRLGQTDEEFCEYLGEHLLEFAMDAEVCLRMTIESFHRLEPAIVQMSEDASEGRMYQIFTDASLAKNCLVLAAVTVITSRNQPRPRTITTWSWAGNARTGRPDNAADPWLPPHLRGQGIGIYENLAAHGGVVMSCEDSRPSPSDAFHVHVDNLGCMFGIIKSWNKNVVGGVVSASLNRFLRDNRLKPVVSYVASERNAADFPTRTRLMQSFQERFKEQQIKPWSWDFDLSFLDVLKLGKKSEARWHAALRRKSNKTGVVEEALTESTEAPGSKKRRLG